uniref:hypothetical protein n=1 Tax=Fulvivirga sp. TaxID=1931237 RepID=UPI0040499F91
MKRLSYYLSDEVISKFFKKISEEKYLITVLIFGIVVRGRQYLTNRSFWLDEAFLANNFKSRDYLQLIEPLDYSQVAPIGFLWAEELMSNLLGLNEFALRLIPFIASIAAIYLLYDLSRILLSKVWGFLIAFAFTLPITITYFASELKQYMTDLFIALVLFWIFYGFIFKKSNYWSIVGIGVVGAICIWFSNITPIILLSLGFALWLPLLKKFDLKKFVAILASNVLWLVSFFSYYQWFIKDNPHREGMISYWSSSFLPHEFSEAFKWLDNTFYDLFRNTASHNEVVYLAMGLFFIGLFSVIIRKSKRHLIYLFLPILTHLILSYFQLYPFSGRLVLYMVPLIILYEFIGIEFIASFFNYRNAVAILLTVAFLLTAFIRTSKYFVHPRMGEDIKPVLQYVKSNKQPDDIVYVYWGSHAAFKFYREDYFTKNDHCIVGISSGDHYDKFLDEFNALNDRIWIVFSHMSPPRGVEYLNEKIPTYEQLDYFEAQGAKVYLVNKN